LLYFPGRGYYPAGLLLSQLVGSWRSVQFAWFNATHHSARRQMAGISGQTSLNPQMHLPENPRILIARMSAIGDTILTMPVLCALRRKFPRAYIAWVVEAGAAPLLQGHECLDELIVLPRRWFKSPPRIWQLRRELRALNFDVTVDCQSISKTALACRLSGTPIRIGAADQHGKELSPWMNNRRVPLVATHLVDRTLEMLAPLGIHSPEVQFRLPIDATAEATIAKFRSDAGMIQPYAVINPGGSWDSKLWPAERFARVALHLGEWHNLPSLVVWAGERERDWAETIVAGSGGHAQLAPSTNLVELASLLRGADLFVGSDTGPLHLAVAVGTTSVGLYGTTRPADCGPYGSRNVALQQRYHGGSSRERRSATNDAMKEITCDLVCQTCDRLLRRDASEPRRVEAA
jgi:heptosyltransferase-1